VATGWRRSCAEGCERVTPGNPAFFAAGCQTTAAATVRRGDTAGVSRLRRRKELSRNQGALTGAQRLVRTLRHEAYVKTPAVKTTVDRVGGGTGNSRTVTRSASTGRFMEKRRGTITRAVRFVNRSC